MVDTVVAIVADVLLVDHVVGGNGVIAAGVDFALAVIFQRVAVDRGMGHRFRHDAVPVEG